MVHLYVAAAAVGMSQDKLTLSSEEIKPVVHCIVKLYVWLKALLNQLVSQLVENYNFIAIYWKGLVMILTIQYYHTTIVNPISP